MKIENKIVYHRSELCLCLSMCVCVCIHTVVLVYCILHVPSCFVVTILTCVKSQNTLKKDYFNRNFQKSKTVFFRVKTGFIEERFTFLLRVLLRYTKGYIVKFL